MRRSCIMLAVLGFATAPAFAQEAPAPEAEQAEPEAEAAPQHKGFLAKFKDEEDGKFDFSNVLAKGGFIPVPIIITEPAVDGGFGVAAAFLKKDPDNPRQITKTAVAAFKTGNGSYGYGAFRGGYLFDGRLDYKIAVGRGKITLTTYPGFAPNGIEYTNHYDYGVLGSAMWHFKDRRFSAGPLFDFRKLRSELDLGPNVPDKFAGAFNRTLHTGALGLGFHFDDRDNPMTPTRGTDAYMQAKFNRGAFGSDRDYTLYAIESYSFDKLGDKWRVGQKLEMKAIRGDFPAYFAPSIDLRGVQSGRYQGMNMASSELEITRQLSPRWSLLAFGGVGATDGGDRRVYKDSGAIFTGGAGFRYRIARKLGLDAGLDFAYGPQGFVFYIQFGHAWSFGMD
ncbi:hypothetical protein HZY97_16615 [Sphingomonas sp. R-74633]|uniref:hypothetical protein n=1 Tax=Sphingomonas sp. R-74633 TaxID=2751188 RepID=UPI0015D1508D|nr:hypothetical protein [Sphingomonas sp. R-74633]NYT42398.1 hypothetical protein [Sphingomonas sp. R-74633]